MDTNKYAFRTLLCSGACFCALLSFSVLMGCSKEEAPPPAEKPKQSLVDQYKDTSKATAENPGIAGSPKQMGEGEKKPAGQ
ncbi:MAG TPA: hypothetical protein VNN62_12885 [Methylomirabilota bacterium]|jgi:hypothetical protein|nr:hypothetical protein [Methylomirabilota bacterium]